MCFPPFCHPATHFLGCFGLRQGAAFVLVLNAAYGLALIVVHSLLLGKASQTQAQQPSYQGQDTGSSAWALQLMDLDLAWTHQLMGIDDQSNIICGLLYGIFIVLICGYMFHTVHQGPAPTTTRWFVAFMNLELIIHIGLTVVKLPKLCTIQANFMPDLHMQCNVQRFLFIERALGLLILASLCTWIFASFAYILTFGHNATVDRPEFAAALDVNDAQQTRTNGIGGLERMPFGTGRNLMASSFSRHSLAETPMARTSLVGGPVQAQSFSHVGSMRVAPGAPMRTSYNIGNIARAGTSMVSSSTDHSYHETQSLIKPPVAIF